MVSAVAKRRPEPDREMSRTEMMAAIDANLGAMEYRLTAGHAALAQRVDKVAADVTTTRLAVARIEGAREAEQRLSKPKPIRKWLTVGAAVSAVVGVIAGLSLAWKTVVAIVLAISAALLAH